MGFVIKSKLKCLKFHLTKLFKKIFESNTIKPLIKNLDNLNQEEQTQYCVDTFTRICCDLLEDERFLCYYEEKFNLSEQIGLMVQLSNNKL
jgi:hypothetical protein